MIDENVKKCNRWKRIVDFITVLIGITIAYPISNIFFKGELVYTISILAIVLLILSRIEVRINKKIDIYFDNVNS